MLFQNKPVLYLQLLNQSMRYMAVQPKTQSIVDCDEVFFENNILEDGEIVNPSLLETRLNALVQEKKWKKANTQILVLNDFVTVREVEVPIQLEANEIKEYLDLHMNQSIRMPFEKPSYDYTVYDQNEEFHKLTLTAYPSEKVAEYQDILQKAGLKPDVADIAALSLYRVAKKQALIPEEADTHIMILQWNPADVSITVFNQDRPTFNRHSQNDTLFNSFEHTPNGEWIWTETEMELEMSIEEQLNSLERFLDFYQYSVLNGEGSISEIILTGYYPDLENLKSRIAERFLIDTQLLKLPDGITQPYGALYGLTLREKNGKKEKKQKKKKDHDRGKRNEDDREEDNNDAS